MILAKKGDWVEIQKVLTDTKRKSKQTSDDVEEPLIQWVRGFMMTEEAIIGDHIEVETIMGRYDKGNLSAVNPRAIYDFDEPMKKLIQMRKELMEELKNEECQL